MRKLQATTQCNWNWFWLSSEGRRGTTSLSESSPPTTINININSAGQLGNFRKTCVTHFQWNIRCEFKDLSGYGTEPGASSALRADNPKKYGAYFLVLSSSFSILCFRFLYLIRCVCVWLFFFWQQMQLFSSCVGRGRGCHDVTYGFVCLWSQLEFWLALDIIYRVEMHNQHIHIFYASPRKLGNW